jgi:hypothetical protein
MGDSQGKTNNTRYQRDGVVREKGLTGLKTDAGWVGVWVVKKGICDPRGIKPTLQSQQRSFLVFKIINKA